MPKGTQRRKPGRPSLLPPVRIPAALPIPIEEPLRVPSADCLVLGDLHVPHHHTTMLRRAILILQRAFPHIRTAIIAGDFFDFSSLSTHPQNAREVDPTDTMQIGGEVLRAIGNHFDHLYICNGNHDERVAKKLDRRWDLQLLVNAALGEVWPRARIHVSNLDYLYVGDTWLVGHPSHYSGQGGKTPSELADVHQYNVISFHNHVIGMAPSKSGFIGIDAGHMTQPDHHYYLKRRLTKYARWQSGFLILSNGYPYMYSEAFTDWEALGL